MASDSVLYEAAPNGVATITLNEPDTRNALSAGDARGLITSSLHSAREDERVRCVVLASSHEKVFSSGANLGGFAGEVPLVHKHFGSERFVDLFRLIGSLGKPTLCAARGHVLAGALGDRARLRSGRRLRAGHLRHARDQRRRLPVHDHGADLPQRAAQEGE